MNQSTIYLHSLPARLSLKTWKEENQKPRIVKTKKRRRYYPKDYARRARLQRVLYENHMTIEELAMELDVNAGQLCAIMWGKLRTRKWEIAISDYFNTTWEDLFGENPEEGAA